MSSVFRARLSERRTGRGDRARTWIFVPYDQLSAGIGPLASRAPEELGILLVENPHKAARRPYHRQKLALILANLRHFALEQAARGVAVRHVVADARGYAGAVEDLAAEVGPLVVQTPAERELRVELARVPGNALRVIPHEGWLTTPEQFRAAVGDRPPWRMDVFYRHVRRSTQILMDGAKPAGGRYSFDTENRKPWRGEPPAPVPPRFTPDEITREVVELVEGAFAAHPGVLDASALPATAADAEALWAWALAECLPSFGPYEDAMSTRSTGLFHTRIAPLLNLHRLLPARVVADVLATPIPLPSQEGFVRQILGWRELVRHVHRETDGFRRVPMGFLGATRPLPPAYWGTPSGLACLDHVVADVWREGWSHHITRLMVLGNLATLLGYAARELSDWFWVAYTDAYDWVVEPNVLAMATFDAGDVMTTKPYVAGSAYIDRMSDYCRGCRFHPKRDCPVTPMYWAFLARNATRLAGNARMQVPLASLRRRTAAQRATDAAITERVAAALAAGERYEPSSGPSVTAPGGSRGRSRG